MFIHCLKNYNSKLKEGIIYGLNLDIICICETFLVDNECINLEGYQWFGSNRKFLSRRAMRGSGGVGVLIKHSLSERYSISIAQPDADIEGILWVQFTGIDGSEDFSIVVCYLPPANSSRGDMSDEFFDHLKSDIFTLQGSGVYCICGDFNTRCGSLSDVNSSPDHDIPCRVLTDHAPPPPPP